MKVVALVATWNEERFIAGCLDHLLAQGLEVYLSDNDSTDRTVEIAAGYLGRGLRRIERLPRDGTYRWREILERKERLAAELDADWFFHFDADEIPMPPRPETTLVAAVAEADAGGANAIELTEFTFVPTREEPDHDHPDFHRTMRWYYPFASFHPLVRGWKRQQGPVDLASTGGHCVDFPGRRIWSSRFQLRHYLFLSVAQAARKYSRRAYDPREVSAGWHGWRANFDFEGLPLPGRAQLREAVAHELDPSEPHSQHCLFWSAR